MPGPRAFELQEQLFVVAHHGVLGEARLDGLARDGAHAVARRAIAQRLVPDITGEGRVPASEILVVTGRVQDLIMNPEETGKITEVIGEGEYYGMRTFDQSLLTYVMEGKIAEEVALDYASSPHDFKLMLAAGGQRASGIEQLGAPVSQ